MNIIRENKIKDGVHWEKIRLKIREDEGRTGNCVVNKKKPSSLKVW